MLTTCLKRPCYWIARILAVTIGLAMAACTTPGAYNAATDFGTAGQENIYDRVITISPTTKWVNVNQDETIKFIDAESRRSFVWYFNTPAMKIDLEKVAPTGMLVGRHVEAYLGYGPRDLQNVPD